ncbi:MerR family transcriptional regulator [Paenibacillus sp. NAIST15-1]|uniref:MerR family transcriptional regulator n=1 Tax=Paenibacillus sp. NAIST15-1 TaxID=1605994 RepID=UPI00086D43CC|nr:MerR family transcriptional regulator [Paenibacillus sp. NAIST15-1]GAV13945.1 putative transcriptional regulator [Paenibacillus sp. NAIST15-1]
MEGYYSIGEVSKRTGATVKTIRYYDEIQLLPASKLNSTGYRYYNDEDIAQLELILLLRYLGFAVQEIKQMLQHDMPVSTSIQWQLEAIEQQIEHLGQMKQILVHAQEQQHRGAPLAYLHDIADIVHKSSRQRQQFIASKMQHALSAKQLPDRWREQVLTACIGFVPKEQELTEDQLHAWSRMSAMLDDPAFVQEINQKLKPYWDAISSQQLDPSPWGEQYVTITNTVLALIEAGENECSTKMQQAALDYVSLVTGSTPPITLDLVRSFLEHGEAMTSERVQQWWELVTALNPSLAPQARAQHMIARTLAYMAGESKWTAGGEST